MKKIFFFFLFILMAYPLLYYSYKFYSPDFGGMDFYFYYPLYKNFDISKTESPFNMRLVSPFLVFLMNKTNLFYHTFIQYKNPDIEQKIFFNAILVNWASVVITSFLLFNYLYNKFNNLMLSILSALLYMFSFGTILFGINPNTDGFSILLITIMFILYKKESKWIYLMYPILLFQREFAFIIFGLLAFADFFHNRANQYYLLNLIFSIVFFLLYYLLRKTIFFTPLYSNQTTEAAFVYSLLNISLDIPAFFRQAILTQNIYFIYFFILLLNGKDRWAEHKYNLILLLVFVIVTFIISRIAVANNNMGRFLHMFSPILIIQMLYSELSECMVQKQQKN